jgi:hypothetical protein
MQRTEPGTTPVLDLPGELAGELRTTARETHTLTEVEPDPAGVFVRERRWRRARPTR